MNNCVVRCHQWYDIWYIKLPIVQLKFQIFDLYAYMFENNEELCSSVDQWYLFGTS